MKVSIITVVYNGEAYIEGCIESVSGQNYPDVEHIIMDGGSKDRTMEIVNRLRDKVAVVVSEKDRGLYDAMNKGIALATGDIIGILNADDVYAAPDVIAAVVDSFKQANAEMVFGDLVVVAEDDLNRVLRYCTAGEFKRRDFEKGDMPPHPSVFVKKAVYEKFGTFNIDFRLAADYEWLLRSAYNGNTQWEHLGKILVKMRTGGMSQRGIQSKVKLNNEIRKACEINGVKTSLLRIYSKYFTKLFQLVRRPKA
jgi:glycosyltransferase involved in cell wall biosynthesis